MITTAEIKQMTRADKLRMMEALWEDLSRSDEEVESPPWHEAELRETRARFEAGEVGISDWESAKRELRRPSA